MTDLEIDKALALAIGWEADQITEHMGYLYVADWPRKYNRQSVLHGGFYHPPMLPWERFSHKDWAVAGPIAERYDCFPRKDGGWYVWGLKLYDTPQEAIALAVIGAKK